MNYNFCNCFLNKLNQILKMFECLPYPLVNRFQIIPIFDEQILHRSCENRTVRIPQILNKYFIQVVPPVNLGVLTHLLHRCSVFGRRTKPNVPSTVLIPIPLSISSSKLLGFGTSIGFVWMLVKEQL